MTRLRNKQLIRLAVALIALFIVTTSIIAWISAGPACGSCTDTCSTRSISESITPFARQCSASSVSQPPYAYPRTS